MSASSDDDPPEKVGYGKPPKSGQFRKGKSGNPNGRPRKKRSATEWPAARHPTREALRAEAARRITVTDAAGRHDVSVREAIARSLALRAMQGGPLATRLWLEFHKVEDERLHQERSKSFEFWQGYKERHQKEIAAARAAGKPEPQPLPHPDDIKCDWETLRVRFVGPMDEEGLAATKWMLDYRNLCFAMSQYTGEDVLGPATSGEEVQIGVYFALFLIASRNLPPRMKLLRDEDMPTVTELMHQRAIGGTDFQRRCEALGVPFVRWKRSLRMALLPASMAGAKWPKDKPFPVASPERVKRSRSRRRPA